MGWFEFILELVGILVPAAKRKRAEDEANRDKPLIDVEEERRKAQEDAVKNRDYY